MLSLHQHDLRRRLHAPRALCAAPCLPWLFCLLKHHQAIGYGPASGCIWLHHGLRQGARNQSKLCRSAGQPLPAHTRGGTAAVSAPAAASQQPRHSAGLKHLCLLPSRLCYGWDGQLIQLEVATANTQTSFYFRLLAQADSRLQLTWHRTSSRPEHRTFGCMAGADSQTQSGVCMSRKRPVCIQKQ